MLPDSFQEVLGMLNGILGVGPGHGVFTVIGKLSRIECPSKRLTYFSGHSIFFDVVLVEKNENAFVSTCFVSV